MRRGTKSGRPVGLVFAALLVLAAGGCRDDAREGNIQKNLPRPGGGVNAILVRHETWDHIYYEVFMREKDGSDELVFRITSAFEGPPDIQWTSPDTLLIRTKCGDIEDYSNGVMLNGDFNFKEIFIGLEGNRLCKEPAAYVKGASKP